MALKSNRRYKLASICRALNHKPYLAVETGTYRGDTTAALSDLFSEVYTIELSRAHYEAAEYRFIGTNVRCLFGDSAQLVPCLAQAILKPICWFLDAHYPFDWPESKRSGLPHTPIPPLFDELAAISERQFSDLILVDDASNFGRPHWENITEKALLRIVRPRKWLKMHDVFCMASG